MNIYIIILYLSFTFFSCCHKNVTDLKMKGNLLKQIKKIEKKYQTRVDSSFDDQKRFEQKMSEQELRLFSKNLSCILTSLEKKINNKKPEILDKLFFDAGRYYSGRGKNKINSIYEAIDSKKQNKNQISLKIIEQFRTEDIKEEICYYTSDCYDDIPSLLERLNSYIDRFKAIDTNLTLDNKYLYDKLKNITSELNIIVEKMHKSLTKKYKNCLNELKKTKKINTEILSYNELKKINTYLYRIRDSFYSLSQNIENFIYKLDYDIINKISSYIIANKLNQLKSKYESIRNDIENISNFFEMESKLDFDNIFLENIINNYQNDYLHFTKTKSYKFFEKSMIKLYSALWLSEYIGTQGCFLPFYKYKSKISIKYHFIAYEFRRNTICCVGSPKLFSNISLFQDYDPKKNLAQIYSKILGTEPKEKEREEFDLYTSHMRKFYNNYSTIQHFIKSSNLYNLDDVSFCKILNQQNKFFEIQKNVISKKHEKYTQLLWMHSIDGLKIRLKLFQNSQKPEFSLSLLECNNNIDIEQLLKTRKDKLKIARLKTNILCFVGARKCDLPNTNLAQYLMKKAHPTIKLFKFKKLSKIQK